MSDTAGPPDPVAEARARLTRAEEAGDEERLDALNDIHRSLEAELDRDVDHHQSPGR